MKVSSGGESDPFKFYATTNQVTYGSSWSKFEPRVDQHQGAGYVSNNRPFLAYSAHLDEIDNPSMGRLVAGNYKSQTHKDYIGYGRPRGNEILPSGTFHAPTGFVRESGTHVPSSLEVQRQFIDRRLRHSPANIGPNHRDLLHTITHRDDDVRENFGHGPKSWSTEYSAKFDGPTAATTRQLKDLKIGPKTVSGFVDNMKTQEPITLNHHSTFKDQSPNCYTARPTGSSSFSHFFQPYGRTDGREPLPGLTEAASRQTGFVLGNKALPDYVDPHAKNAYKDVNAFPDGGLDKLRREDLAEYMNVMHPNPHSTLYRNAFNGQQNPQETVADRLNRTSVGFQENTGHSSNPVSYVQTRDDPRRFITYNMTKLYDPTPLNADRHGHVNFSVDPMPPNAFTRSTAVHKIEPQTDAMSILTHMTPYQAKSIIYRESLPTAPTKMLSA